MIDNMVVLPADSLKELSYQSGNLVFMKFLCASWQHE